MADPFERPEPESWPATAAMAIAVGMTLVAASALIQGVYFQAELGVRGGGWRLAITTAGMGSLSVGSVSVGLSAAPFVAAALLLGLVLAAQGDPRDGQARRAVALTRVISGWLLLLTVLGLLINFEGLSHNAAIATSAILADAASLALLATAFRWSRSLQ